MIDGGLGRRWMTEGAVRRQRAIDSGERPWVTVNMWRQTPNVPHTAFRVNPENTRRQLERLRQVKASRNQERVRAALSGIDDAWRTGANMVPSVLEAVRAYVTVGEITDRWRNHYGVFTPSTDF